MRKGTYRYLSRRTYRKRPTSYLRPAEYKRQMIAASALNHKFHSVNSVSWESKIRANEYRVEQICPYKTDKGFWTIAGGAVINADATFKKVYVRGGSWSLTISNCADAEATIDCYLAFIKDGSELQNIEGTVNNNWHPYLSGERFTDCFRLSRYIKSFILLPKRSHRQKFKIGHFKCDVTNWFNDKPGWPFLFVCFRPTNPTLSVCLRFTMDWNLSFARIEDLKIAMSREEANKLQMALNHFKETLGLQVAGTADTTMDFSARQTIG